MKHTKDLAQRIPLAGIGVLLVALLLGLGCSRQRDAAVTPVTLAGDLEPLRDHFNAHRTVPRVVMMLSPT